MCKRECVVMILAGGQSSRLGALTEKTAKPAIPFGGKYRIIDFVLSNCSNSNFDTIGVLTQYQPLILHSYIGIGSAWDLNRKSGGITILPPYLTRNGSDWYKGTANAIFQNMDFIDQYDPEYVLILSGDQIYKMDYNKILYYHKEKKADATVSVVSIPWEETHRFGIVNINEDNRILDFQEKPNRAKNNLASMGIYVFNWQLLKNYLYKDEQDISSRNDFGQNIIPSMLNNGVKIYSYHFTGYWKDVGTIKSYWEANMDLLSDHDALNLNEPIWKIYSVGLMQPSCYISDTANVRHSIISDGCKIYGEIYRCVIFSGVSIGAKTIIKNSVIMSNAKIGENVLIENVIITENTIIDSSCHISNKILDNSILPATSVI